MEAGIAVLQNKRSALNIGQARGTVLGILTSSYIAIMIDFDLKHKVIHP
jgi:hypothetical protein